MNRSVACGISDGGVRVELMLGGIATHVKMHVSKVRMVVVRSLLPWPRYLTTAYGSLSGVLAGVALHRRVSIWY